jgi:hypothetical protein
MLMNPGSINLKAVEGPFDSSDSDSSCVIPIESSPPVSLMITILGFKLVSAVRYSAWWLRIRKESLLFGSEFAFGFFRPYAQRRIGARF